MHLSGSRSDLLRVLYCGVYTVHGRLPWGRFAIIMRAINRTNSRELVTRCRDIIGCVIESRDIVFYRVYSRFFLNRESYYMFCVSHCVEHNETNFNTVKHKMNLLELFHIKSRFRRLTPAFSILHWLPVRYSYYHFQGVAVSTSILSRRQLSTMRSLRSSSLVSIICVPTRKPQCQNQNHFNPLHQISGINYHVILHDMVVYYGSEHWWLPAHGAPCTCPGIHLPDKTKCHLHS